MRYSVGEIIVRGSEPMSLQQQITADMTAAMKAQDAARLSALRMIKAALMNRQIEKGGELSDDETLKALNTLAKQRRDAAGQYLAANRAELAAKEQAELAVIENYLPQSAGAEQIAQAVAAAVAATGATTMRDMGAVMKAAQANLAGLNVDGRALSEAVKTRLSG
jgi:uncharacterized protein YqeY